MLLSKRKFCRTKLSRKKLENCCFRYIPSETDTFIHNMDKNAGLNRLIVLKCTTNDKRNTAKKFRQKYFFDYWEFLIHIAGLLIIQITNIFVTLCGRNYRMRIYSTLTESRATLHIIVIPEESRNQSFDSLFIATIKKLLRVYDYKSFHLDWSKEDLNLCKSTNISKYHSMIWANTKTNFMI